MRVPRCWSRLLWKRQPALAAAQSSAETRWSAEALPETRQPLPVEQAEAGQRVWARTRF